MNPATPRPLYTVTILVFLLAGCLPDDRASRSEPTAEEVESSGPWIGRAERFGVEPVPPSGITIESPFSVIHIRERGTRRSLLFVSESGVAFEESRMDLAQPHRLEVPYTRAMFVSYLFSEQPERVLIVGLGAGSMVRFLELYDSDVLVDAIDIDPAVVEVATSYFGTLPSDRVRLLTADGYRFIRTSEEMYDVVYMDAFLEPSGETDSAGVPLNLRQTPFYEALRQRLSPGGIVVFNIHPDSTLEERIAKIHGSFESVQRFSVDGAENLILVAAMEEALVLSELQARAERRDREAPASLSFAELVAGYH